MTPEQREELKDAAQAVTQHDGYSVGVAAKYRAIANPAAILSLIAQVEALSRKNLELQRVYDERGLQIERLEVALQRAKVEALTVPQGWKLVPVEPTPEMNSAPNMIIQAYGARLIYQYMLQAAPTIPAIPGTKEGSLNGLMCCSGGPQWGHAWDCPSLP